MKYLSTASLTILVLVLATWMAFSCSGMLVELFQASSPDIQLGRQRMPYLPAD